MENNEIHDTKPKPTAKKKKKSSCFSRLAKFTLVVFFVWWFNNFTLKTVQYDITSDKINSEITIAVLSDFHANEDTFSIKNETVLKKIRKINPDVVCALGDMHSNDATEAEKKMSMDLMTDIIDEGYKLYFVLGEHDDRTNAYVAEMEKNKITVLDGESETMVINENKITFYGISNAYFSPSFDLRNEFSINKDSYNILLAHIPMYDDYEKFGADLTLSGDTHGGVIQIPFVGPAYYDGRFLPELYMDKKRIFDKGLFDYDGGKLFITSGIGNFIDSHNIPVRFFNRPEIGVITISPDK